jgi:short-subunit dehydrogenase
MILIPQGLAQTLELLKGTQPKAVYSKAFDVGDKDAMYTFAAEVKAQLGSAHVIINNAGIASNGLPVWLKDEADYERTMQVNFFGVLYGTRAFLPQLLENGEGAVVNVSSVFGLVGTPETSDYCASKFAVRGFTEALMVELHESPISVHLVHPGGVKTNIAKGVEGGEEFADKFLKTDPLDVARHVIKCIRSGKQRIVFGHQSFRVWLASWAMSLERRNRLIFKQMKDLRDPKNYRLLGAKDR